MIGRWVTHLTRAGACVATVLLGVALVVHATVRDLHPPWQIAFYATPWPVLAAIAGLLAVYWARHGGRLLAAFFVVVALASSVLWFQQGWHWAQPSTARGELRVVLWNVDRPNWRLPGVMEWLRAQDADVIAIAEFEPRDKQLFERWRTAFPEYELRPSEDQMLCFVRGKMHSLEDRLLEKGSFATRMRVRVRERELTILQVDIRAAPIANRREPLTRLSQIIAGHRGENLLVIGDFNSPLESAFMPALRAEAANAFETAGRGLAATWPRPLPVLSLDQMWTNAGLRAVRCEHVTSWRSDHRAVVAEFNFTR